MIYVTLLLSAVSVSELELRLWLVYVDYLSPSNSFSYVLIIWL